MTDNMTARPNILYIMSDQHAARVMGCAGDTAADTPNLDRLAQSGARFTRAYGSVANFDLKRDGALTGHSYPASSAN